MLTKPSGSNKDRARAATSQDVAKLAGVSRATVSYILNKRQGVSFSKETRKAVEKAATELGYRPNAAAKSLVSGTGPLVCVLADLPQNELTSNVWGEISRELAQRGILTTILQVNPDYDLLVATIAGYNPRAVLFVFDPGAEIRKRIEEKRIPIILVSQIADPAGLNMIAISQVEYLTSKGHSQLAFADISGSDAPGVQPRRQEFSEVCAAKGLPTPLVAEIARNGVNSAETIRKWFEAGVTAVGTFNDEVALAVLYGIREAGLCCPRDMAVIGVDDIPAAAVSFPPLTSIGAQRLGATKWLLSLVLRELGLPAADCPLPTDLMRVIERESC